MFRILPLLCDIGLGILSTAFVEWILAGEFTALHYGAGILCALLLDCDAVLDKEFWRSGYVASYAENTYDHREFMHKPLLWLLGCVLLGFFVPIEWALILGVGTFVHFVHDSVGTGWGIGWLWPFTRRNYKFFATRENQLTLKQFVVSWSHDELPSFIYRYGVKEWIALLYLRPTPVSLIEYSIFGVAVLFLALRAVV